MKVLEIEIDYQVTRSRDYQSVRIGGSMRIQLDEGDDKLTIIDKARRFLANNLNIAAQEELDNVLFGPDGSR